MDAALSDADTIQALGDAKKDESPVVEADGESTSLEPKKPNLESAATGSEQNDQGNPADISYKEQQDCESSSDSIKNNAIEDAKENILSAESRTETGENKVQATCIGKTEISYKEIEESEDAPVIVIPSSTAVGNTKESISTQNAKVKENIKEVQEDETSIVAKCEDMKGHMLSSRDGNAKKDSAVNAAARSLGSSSKFLDKTDSRRSSGGLLQGRPSRNTLLRRGSTAAFLDTELGEAHQAILDNTVNLKEEYRETQASVKSELKLLRHREKELSMLSNRVNHLKKEHAQLLKKIAETHKRAEGVETRKRERRKKAEERREMLQREEERLRKEAESNAKLAQELKEKAKRSAEAAKQKKAEGVQQCMSQRQKLRLEKKKFEEEELGEKRSMREERVKELRLKKQKERRKELQRRKDAERSRAEALQKNKALAEKRRQQLEELEDYEAALIEKLKAIQQDEAQAYNELEETI